MNDCNSTKGTILLVDDLPENLHLLSDLLINIGYTVRSVNSGSIRAISFFWIPDRMKFCAITISEQDDELTYRFPSRAY